MAKYIGCVDKDGINRVDVMAYPKNVRRVTLTIDESMACLKPEEARELAALLIKAAGRKEKSDG